MFVMDVLVYFKSKPTENRFVKPLSIIYLTPMTSDCDGPIPVGFDSFS